MKYYFVILFSFASLILTAQDSGTVSGLISDKEFNNEPLAFANVLIKGSSKGTTSDFDGNYFLDNMAPGVYTIQFSYVGYETVEIETLSSLANCLSKLINNDHYSSILY